MTNSVGNAAKRAADSVMNLAGFAVNLTIDAMSAAQKTGILEDLANGKPVTANKTYDCVIETISKGEERTEDGPELVEKLKSVADRKVKPVAGFIDFCIEKSARDEEARQKAEKIRRDAEEANRQRQQQANIQNNNPPQPPPPPGPNPPPGANGGAQNHQNNNVNAQNNNPPPPPPGPNLPPANGGPQNRHNNNANPQNNNPPQPPPPPAANHPRRPPFPNNRNGHNNVRNGYEIRNGQVYRIINGVLTPVVASNRPQQRISVAPQRQAVHHNNAQAVPPQQQNFANKEQLRVPTTTASRHSSEPHIKSLSELSQNNDAPLPSNNSNNDIHQAIPQSNTQISRVERIAQTVVNDEREAKQKASSSQLDQDSLNANKYVSQSLYEVRGNKIKELRHELEQAREKEELLTQEQEFLSSRNKELEDENTLLRDELARLRSKLNIKPKSAIARLQANILYKHKNKVQKEKDVESDLGADYQYSASDYDLLREEKYQQKEKDKRK